MYTAEELGNLNKRNAEIHLRTCKEKWRKVE